MPNHRKRHRGRPKRRVIAALHDVIHDQLHDPKGHLWVRRWLLPNKENQNSLIPRQAGTTITQGLARLFEMPYQAICKVASESPSAEMHPYVCPNDVGHSVVVVIDINRNLVVSVFKHKAWEFRFTNVTRLEEWLTFRVDELQSNWRELTKHADK